MHLKFDQSDARDQRLEKRDDRGRRGRTALSEPPACTMNAYGSVMDASAGDESVPTTPSSHYHDSVSAAEERSNPAHASSSSSNSSTGRLRWLVVPMLMVAGVAVVASKASVAGGKAGSQYTDMLRQLWQKHLELANSYADTSREGSTNPTTDASGTDGVEMLSGGEGAGMSCTQMFASSLPGRGSSLSSSGWPNMLCETNDATYAASTFDSVEEAVAEAVASSDDDMTDCVTYTAGAGKKDGFAACSNLLWPMPRHYYASAKGEQSERTMSSQATFTLSGKAKGSTILQSAIKR